MKETNGIRVPAILDRLHELQTFVLARAEALGLPPESSGKLELVMEELTVNAINYAYPNTTGDLEVHCLLKEEIQPRFCVQIRDWGTPFNPLAREEAPNTNLDVEDRPVGGLGIFLAEQMSDSIQYKRQKNSNLLTFCFNLPPST